MTIYVVLVLYNEQGTANVSSTGYKEKADAVKFIRSRIDDPVTQDGWKFTTKYGKTTYQIMVVQV